jgi:hypothetical protein
VFTTHISKTIATAIALGFFAFMPERALAHCDGLDGPVVKAAQRALDPQSSARADLGAGEGRT